MPEMRELVKRAGSLGVVFILVGVVAACGGNASATTKSTPSPSATLSDTAAVRQAWQTFFAGTTSASQKVQLLQNGQQFAKVIQAQAGLPMAQGTQATVSKVTVTSPTTADVIYSISIGGQVALAHQKGQAVKQGGMWKVGDKSFQALLSMEGQGMPSTLPSP